jgi:chromosome segregation protein
LLLKSLEIQGFKSFPDKTKIDFGSGLTAVVGPNGSGKSNISDAMRWVMGEQSTRNLRGARMEDVIFTGTRNRKSQGFAEVSLYIDNSDKTLPMEQQEVKITRKYYRSGESEYRINGDEVRLRDIHELFMDTGLGRDGYAMVGQGRIAEIVQSRSDERREIFEEAAGISKYRYRKNDAEKKLSSAEENLVRLQDILGELEERVAPLEEQSKKAKEFLDLAQRKKTLEISSWMYTLEQENQLLKDQQDKILARQLAHEEVEEQQKQMELEIQNLYTRMQQCLVEIDELRRQKEQASQEVSQIEASIAVCQNDLEHNRQNKLRMENQMVQFQENQNAFAKLHSEKQEDLDELNESLEQAEEDIVYKESLLLELSRKAEQAAGQIGTLNQEINSLLMRQSQNKLEGIQLAAQRDEEKEQFEKNQLQLKQKEEDIHLNQRELEQALELSAHLDDRNQEIENMLKGYELKLSRREEQLQTIRKELSGLDLQYKEKQQKAKLLSDLEENLEGFAYSVKAVLQAGKRGVLKGIRGTVAQLLTVSETYSVAIETALGGSLQHIVVENENCGKNAIGYLKRENAGRATVLPMTAVKGNRISSSGFRGEEGYVAAAYELVTFDPQYQGIVDSLLGRILVAEDLDSAVAIAKKNQYKFRIVTLDGQLVNAGGSMTGGSRGKAPGFLSRKADITKLTGEAEKLSEKITQVKEQIVKLEQDMAAQKGKTYGLRNEWTAVREDRIRCEGEEKRLTQLIQQETEELKQMRRNLEQYQNRAAGQEDRAHTIRTELDQIDRQLEEKRTVLSKLQSSSDQQEDQRRQLSEECSQSRYHKMEIQRDIQVLEHEMESLKQRGSDTKAQLAALEQELKQLIQSDDDLVKTIENHRRMIEQKRTGSASMEQQVQEKTHLRNSLENKATQMRQEEKTVLVKKEQISQEWARAEERRQSIQKDYDGIIARLWEEYQLTRSEAAEFAEEVEDIKETNRQLSFVKGQIKALGNVNVSAIEEYQEVYERYRFLKDQLEDVRKSKGELTRLIEDLTVQMKEIFARNFQQINSNFQKIFIDLFGGGQAELRLTDPEDILNCGIEIFVEPPGKIIRNLSLLSGGEQAFVAIAIYFAILKVRPAPFCILDEIEAALDDVNVGKYAHYLRRMSDQTQFIMITHRRGSMEEADMLYGVTMQEEGVSKLLPLNISEIEREMGEAVS